MSGLFNFPDKITINSRGSISLIVVLSILTAISAIALGSSFIISSELKLSSSVSDSVVAYYAAEAGIEQALYTAIKDSVDPVTTCGVSWVAVGNAQYCLSITGSLTGGDLSIQSTGEYPTGAANATRRSIKISF